MDSEISFKVTVCVKIQEIAIVEDNHALAIFVFKIKLKCIIVRGSFNILKYREMYL